MYYYNVSIILLRLLAFYMATICIDKFSTLFFSLRGIENTTPYIINFALYLSVTLIIWFFAPIFARKMMIGMQEEEKSNVNTENICSAILIAAGFLILAKSFYYYSFWIADLLPNNGKKINLDSRDLFVSIAYTILALLLILSPKGILNSIKIIKEHSSKTIKELRK